MEELEKKIIKIKEENDKKVREIVEEQQSIDDFYQEEIKRLEQEKINNKNDKDALREIAEEINAKNKECEDKIAELNEAKENLNNDYESKSTLLKNIIQEVNEKKLKDLDEKNIIVNKESIEKYYQEEFEKLEQEKINNKNDRDALFEINEEINVKKQEYDEKMQKFDSDINFIKEMKNKLEENNIDIEFKKEEASKVIDETTNTETKNQTEAAEAPEVGNQTEATEAPEVGNQAEATEAPEVESQAKATEAPEVENETKTTKKPEVKLTEIDLMNKIFSDYQAGDINLTDNYDKILEACNIYNDKFNEPKPSKKDKKTFIKLFEKDLLKMKNISDMEKIEILSLIKNEKYNRLSGKIFGIPFGNKRIKNVDKTYSALNAGSIEDIENILKRYNELNKKENLITKEKTQKGIIEKLLPSIRAIAAYSVVKNKMPVGIFDRIKNNFSKTKALPAASFERINSLLAGKDIDENDKKDFNSQLEQGVNKEISSQNIEFKQEEQELDHDEI